MRRGCVAERACRDGACRDAGVFKGVWTWRPSQRRSNHTVPLCTLPPVPPARGIRWGRVERLNVASTRQAVPSALYGGPSGKPNAALPVPCPRAPSKLVPRADAAKRKAHLIGGTSAAAYHPCTAPKPHSKAPLQNVLLAPLLPKGKRISCATLHQQRACPALVLPLSRPAPRSRCRPKHTFAAGHPIQAHQRIR